MSERPHEPRRLADGGDGTPSGAWVGGLLSRLGDQEPGPHDRDRIWARLESRRAPRRRTGWSLVAAGAAAAAMLAVAMGIALKTADPVLPTAALAMLSLAAGEVYTSGQGSPRVVARAGTSLASDNRVETGTRSRAFVQFTDSGQARGLLIEANSALWLGGSQAVRLESGTLVADVAPRRGEFEVTVAVYRVTVVGAFFTARVVVDDVQLEVGTGEARIQGAGVDARVDAGRCWSRRDGVTPCANDGDHALVHLLSSDAAARSYLRIIGVDTTVHIDGVPVGMEPVQWWSPVGRHRISTLAATGELAGDIEVVAGQDALFDFRTLNTRQPAAAPERARTAMQAKRNDAVRKALPEPTDPSDVVALLRRQLAAGAAGDDRERLLYELGVILTRLGRYRDALDPFNEVSRGKSSHAELALYEVGRLKQRYLDDAGGAQIALDAYRRRYPDGVVRQEVDLTLIETLLAEKQFDRAAVEINAFLSAYPASERQADVLLLRGNLQRSRGNCRAAITDYEAVVAQSDGLATDDAAYFAALCTAKLGDVGQARQRLSDYLRQFASGRHRSEAERALNEK